jgi:hypothetical protein
MTRRQIDQLDAPGRQKGITGDEKSVGPLACERCKHHFDFLAGSGFEDLDLQPHGAGSRFHVSQRGVRFQNIRANEQANANRPRHQFTEDFQPLCY